MNLKKFVGTGPSSYKKRIYRAAVSRKLRNTALHNVLKQTTSHSSRCLYVSFKLVKVTMSERGSRGLAIHFL